MNINLLKKVDGKTTSELLKNQHKFIQFNALRTLNNRSAAQSEYLSKFGYTTIDQVREEITKIRFTKLEYQRAKKRSKYAKDTFELYDQYRRYKQGTLKSYVVIQK